jgi:hypothetical protein
VVAAYLDRQFQAVADRAVPLLAAAVPGVSPGELRERLRLLLDAVAMRYAAVPDPGEPADDVDTQLARLVTFGAAGLVAPPTPSPHKPVKPTKAKRTKPRSR